VECSSQVEVEDNIELQILYFQKNATKFSKTNAWFIHGMAAMLDLGK